MTLGISAKGVFDLAGKVAVVTGAASGIGRATAQILADAGASVVVADLDEPGAAQVSAELGESAFSIGFDLRSDASTEALFEQAVERFGRLDILINNAGIYPKYSFDRLDRSDWEEMQQVNVWGCFVAMRAASRQMRKTGGGRIVNISSIGAARTAVNDQIAYNASKAALDSMTLSAALEMAKDGILVNSVLPGAVRPLVARPRVSGHVPPTGPLMDKGRILLGRAAEPQEIAGPILMLCASAGGYITGQTIVIDGGFSVS